MFVIQMTERNFKNSSRVIFRYINCLWLGHPVNARFYDCKSRGTACFLSIFFRVNSTFFGVGSGVGRGVLTFICTCARHACRLGWGLGWGGCITFIWGLFKIMVPQNCPYAALSRTFRVLSRPSRIGTWNIIMFLCAYFVLKIYSRIVFKLHL